MDCYHLCCSRVQAAVRHDQPDQEEGQSGLVSCFVFVPFNPCIFFSLGAVGRFPTQEDRDAYNIPEDRMFWVCPDYENEEYVKILPSLLKALKY